MITGREPQLTTTHTHGLQRLSPRRLGTLLNLLNPDAISLDAAAAMLRNNNFYTRYNAARLLAQRGDRAARLVMAEALDADEVPTRAVVARQLHRFSWYSAEGLLRQALADADERVREAAVYALCDLRQLHAYQLLEETLAGEVDVVLKAAAWSLRAAPDPAAIPVLAQTIRAADPEVRIQALEALAASQQSDAMPIIRAALDDADPDVAYNAALSLVELDGMGELAEHVLQHADTGCEPALRGLFHASNYLHIDLANHPALDALLAALDAALNSPDTATRSAAIWPLAGLRHPESAALLTSAFEAEPDAEVQVHMLRVTTSLMRDDVFKALAERAPDSPHAVVRSLAVALHVAHQRGDMAAYDPAATAAAPLQRAELIRNA